MGVFPRWFKDMDAGTKPVFLLSSYCYGYTFAVFTIVSWARPGWITTRSSRCLRAVAARRSCSS